MLELTDKEYFDLYGDGGPYSEVNILIQTRILDQKEARSFLYIEAMINPTTIKILKKNKHLFANQYPEIVEYINSAKYMGNEIGYTLIVGPTTQIVEKNFTEVFQNAQIYKENAIKIIIKMHEIVMDLIGLKN